MGQQDIVNDEKKTKKVSKKDIGFLLIITIVFVVLSLIINKVYFSENKAGNIIESENAKLIYPAYEDCIQGFTIPYKTYGFYVEMFSESSEGAPVTIMLLDENFNLLYDWNIQVQDVLENNKVYLSLNNGVLSSGNKYYLYAISDEESPLSIICYDEKRNGYLSTDQNGYVWAYAFEYNSFSYIIVVVELLALYTIILVYLLRRVDISEWKVFSLLYVVLVIAFFVLMPFNTAFDEAGHFTRAYEVSKGRMVSQHDSDGSGISLIPAESAYLIQTSVLEHENFLYKTSYEKSSLN